MNHDFELFSQKKFNEKPIRIETVNNTQQYTKQYTNLERNPKSNKRPFT